MAAWSAEQMAPLTATSTAPERAVSWESELADWDTTTAAVTVAQRGRSSASMLGTKDAKSVDMRVAEKDSLAAATTASGLDDS